MRLLASILLFLMAADFESGSHASVRPDPTTQPDILMYGKLNQAPASQTLTRLRRLFTNQGIIDPFSMKFDRPLQWVLTLAEVSDPELKKSLVDYARIFSLDFETARIILSLDEFEHHARQVKTSMLAHQKAADTVGLDVFGEVGDAEILARQLKVQIKLLPKGYRQDDICYLPQNYRAEMLKSRALKQKKTLSAPICDDKQFVILADVAVPNPRITTRADVLLPFSFDAEVSIKNHFRIDVLESCFEELYQRVTNDPSIIDLGKLNLSGIPDVTLRVGHSAYTLPSAVIQKYVQSQDVRIKNALLGLLIDGVRTKIGSALLSFLEYEELRREIWVSESIMSGFDTRQINVVNSQQLEIVIDGHFCSPEEFQNMKFECSGIQQYPGLYRSKWTAQNLARSKSMIQDQMLKDENQLLLSMSENYVNRLLFETVELGFWNDMLKESGARLGPRQAFMMLDEEGTRGKLVMDILYPVPKGYRMALGKKDIRFPIVFDVETYFGSSFRKLGNDIVIDPVFTVQLLKANVDRKFLKLGMPEAGIESNLGRLFKRKVAKMIAKAVMPYEGKTYPLVTLPALSGLGLEGLRVVSDGQGRATVSLKAN